MKVFFFKILGWIWSNYSVAVEYCKLPKIPDYKDAEKFYVYVAKIINSKFLQLLTDKTPFYVDNAILAQLKVIIADKETFFKAHKALTGIISTSSLSLREWDMWNFLNTIYANRALL